MSTSTRLLAGTLALTLTGCVIGSESYPRPRDLPDSSLVDRPRILGIQAEPPEVRPGEIVTFSALVGDPDEVLDITIWLACTDGGTFGCDTDFGALSEDASPEELAEAGVIGIEPFFDPVMEVPTDMLDDVPAENRLEGVQFTIQVAALPQSDDTGAEVDFNDVEVAYKRLVISEATTPNHNPGLQNWRVDGAFVPDGGVVIVDAGQEYDVSVELTEDSVEDYVYVNSEGVSEDRSEEPYLTWYASNGAWNGNLTVPLNGFDAPLEAKWRAPDEPGEGTWYVVARDRRGGQAWLTQSYRVQ